MKNKIIFLFCLICAAFNLSAQQKFNVQNGAKTEFYASLDSAVQKAVSGDTIYLPGGVINIQNNLVIDKKLSIIGMGCDIDSVGTGLQPTQIMTGGFSNAKITFNPGSEGSLLTGCIVGSIELGTSNNPVSTTIQDITIWRNKIVSSVTLGLSLNTTVKNIVVSENMIGNAVYGNTAGGVTSDCIINNNVCNVSISNFKNSIIHNNAVAPYYYYDYSYGSGITGLDGCTVENNYFFGIFSDSVKSINSTFNNNAFAGNLSFPVGSNTGNNNLVGQIPAITFKGGTPPPTPVMTSSSLNNNFAVKKVAGDPGGGGDGTPGTNGDYTLPKNLVIQDTSLCKNAGKDGTDVGIFGGTNPYKNGAVPFNPHVKQFSVSTQANNKYLNVNIQVSAQEAKANNKIVAYEYWFNDAYDKKVTVETAPQQTFTLSDSVNCSSADKINNTISYRFLDDSGLWSSTLTADFVQPLTISINYTYTRSVLSGETPVTESGYPNYADVGFTLHNFTKGTDITYVSTQYPNIVLTQPISDGDSIAVTAIGYNSVNGFDPITKTLVLGENNTIPLTFDIVQRGYIRVNYLYSENEANVGILFDSIGRKIAQYYYINQTLTTAPMRNGNYQLLSMAKNLFFNSIQNLSDMDSTELKPDTHYILQTLEVKRGVITETNITTIPKLDENQLIYTTNNTLFSVNKSTIAIDNFVTLRSAVEFKEEYRGQIGNLKLIVDIPDSCSFFDKSVMIGDSVFDGYTIQNNQLTVPMKTDSDIVQFCIVPKQGGNYAPNAYIEFTLNGKKIRQPIGAAYFQAEMFSIYTPNTIAQKTITLRGIVPAKSLVKIYDNDTYIGQTTALANGSWKFQGDLYEAYNYTFHDIHGEILTTQGLSLQSRTIEVFYDSTTVKLSNVTMYNTDFHHIVNITKFDFLNNKTTGNSYSYYPAYTDFTFTIDLTNNDTTVVSNVKLYMLTSSKTVVNLPTIYDPAKGLWVATGKFHSNSLPINTRVDFEQSFAQSGVFLKSDNLKYYTFGSIMSQCRAIYQKYKKCNKIDNSDDLYLYKIIVMEYMDYIHNNPSSIYDNIWGREDDPSSVYIPCRAAHLLGSFIRSSFNPDPFYEDLNNFSFAPGQKNILDIIQQLLYTIENASCDCGSGGGGSGDPGGGGSGDPGGGGSGDPGGGGSGDPGGGGSGSGTPDSNPILDPSGFVYEAVPSNRLQGVTATIYHKTNEADESVLWDAAEYEQENPLTTNEYGEYAWDVPQDLWQVKYEKEGYETTYSKWLPVPPPQLNINIAMVNGVPPFVKEAKGYEEGIDITFSKFMLPATMTTDSISVTRNGEEVAGTISLLDSEENPSNPGESFVSKVRFIPATPFLMTDEVILTVDSMVLSYAGRNMTEDFVKQIQIRKEVKSLTATPVLNVAINGKGYIEVSAEPFDAAAGKTVTARSVSSAIATVTGAATLDADGKAKLQVTGELPGSAQIIISLDGTDLKATTTVNIAMELAGQEIEQVEMPTASIPTGSTVDKNTTVSLSSATEGATIYYSLDGSAPSESTGIKYTQPIVLTATVTVKAIAVKEGMTASEVAVFEYTVKEQPPVIEQVEMPTASIPSGSSVTKNTTVSLSTATEGASIYFTDDNSAPSASNGSVYTQPISLTKDVTIKAIAVKEGMTDSEIAVFEYTVNIETGIDSGIRSVILFVQNQTLFIRGLKPGEQYTVYSALGSIVVQGEVTSDVEQQVTLPYKGIYVVSTPVVKAKVLVK